MRIALRLGILPPSFALFASGCAPIQYETLGPARPAVKSESVHVFVFRPPECVFEVVGTLSLTTVRPIVRRLYSSDCRPATHYVEFYAGDIRRQAGKRGADVVWFQSDTIKFMEGYCDYDSDDDSGPATHRDCHVHFVEGVLGRCRD